MPTNYQALEIKPLQVAATLCEPNYYPYDSITLEDPAGKAMTDLTKVSAITISPACSLDEVIDRMQKMKVKLLFVTDAKDRIIGLITYSDLQGERPIQFQQTNGVSRSEICVLDIMTSIDSIDAMEWNAVERARVGDIVSTMKKLNRQHALVLEHPDEDNYRIRGIFSTSLLSKLLGIEIESNEMAQTFAEFERILASKL
ncbi:CBS domain-containing protein [sulfur-oxidizing endosymbiont of Gigantopelta aegis]|uniref:CBS domain-containing protein n=2 Tax=sulfur-oxidizing endosymbiont of Gigantopelta aegis TaxID=2794934 RepID=UPI0018DCABAE|nr:CBS domain-containing protein [sulfur-oxidizing endosymbiont of Gigantopelta aegis]